MLGIRFILGLFRAGVFSRRFLSNFDGHNSGGRRSRRGAAQRYLCRRSLRPPQNSTTATSSEGSSGDASLQAIDMQQTEAKTQALDHSGGNRIRTRGRHKSAVAFSVLLGLWYLWPLRLKSVEPGAPSRYLPLGRSRGDADLPRGLGSESDDTLIFKRRT
jgi:hypothetical protein